MALTRDWELRIERWCQALRERLAVPVEDLPVEFAATTEHLSAEQARRKLRFKPIRPGERWGREWEYGWFRCTARVKPAGRGKAVVLSGQVGEEDTESVVFVNGRAAGGLNRWHRHIDLTPLARAGRPAEVLLESYAGHRRPDMQCQFVRPGRSLMPPPLRRRQRFGGLWLGEWNEQAFQLWMDAETLRRLMKVLPSGSLRRHRLERGMTELTCLLDLEAPEEDLSAGIPAARRHLAPLLRARNGTTMPEMCCFGHSHIDVAWLWPLAQTYRKSAQTFSSMLDLMDRYKEFRFLQSQAQLYDFLKAQYPEIYARIKRAARRGQWIPDGAMWVEADMNVSGGEALIRQFLLGKRFFRDEFGVECELCWLPDVFGYNANLPQILRGCGVKHFSTMKIWWNYHGGTTFPYETFTWEGIDGSTVLAHLHRNYNAEAHPEAVARRWADCVHKGATETFLYPFGWGDGGGGPTREHLEYIRRQGDLEGLPRMRYAAPAEFFAALDRSAPPTDRYSGELYLEAHRGTYTSQARIKRGNRKGELALREAEMWSAFASSERGRKYPAGRLESMWKKLLLNQFHDILPGSAIARVCEQAEALHREVLTGADDIASRARRSLSGGGDGWTVWNSLSWARDALVSLPAAGCPEDAEGNPLPAQAVGGRGRRRLLVAVADVPACGGKTVRLRRGRPVGVPADRVTAAECRGGVVLDNGQLRLRIDRRGEIAELHDLQAGRQLVPRGAAMNRLELYRDNPAAWDAWDIDMSYRGASVRLGPAWRVRIVAAGPLEARVAVARKVGKSAVEQEIVLRAGSRRVDFHTRVDWRETHRLLKVAFPADLSAPVLRGEIQFGHVVRPTHRNYEFERQRFEWPAQKWADLSESGYGVALLNDCKYGYDVLDGVLRLTLLRAPVAPDPQADRGRHEFTYALLPHNGAFADGEVVRAAYELNVPVAVEPGRCRGGRRQFLELSGRGVVVETVKRSEDGRQTAVRMYECLGGTAEADIRIAADVQSAAECDMLENPRRKLRLRRGGEVRLRLGPFEVKTVCFR